MAIESVLVAVDFGDASARAVALAGAIAGRTGAALRLLHAEATDAPVYFTADQLDQLERQRQSIRTQAERFLARFGRDHTATPVTGGIVDTRPPADAILDASAGADLVVMGTHGRSAAQRWWLGSVAERVLRTIARPLLVVHAARAERTPHAPDRLFDRTVVHATEPLRGDATLTLARRLAASFGGTVTDERHGAIEPALERWDATLLVAAVPEPRSAAWTSSYGEPLLRSCTIPMLFVPEPTEGAPR